MDSEWSDLNVKSMRHSFCPAKIEESRCTVKTTTICACIAILSNYIKRQHSRNLLIGSVLNDLLEHNKSSYSNCLIEWRFAQTYIHIMIYVVEHLVAKFHEDFHQINSNKVCEQYIKLMC